MRTASQRNPGPLQAEELSRKTISIRDAYATYYAYKQWAATKGTDVGALLDYQVAIQQSTDTYVIQFMHLSQRKSVDRSATYSVDKRTNTVSELAAAQIAPTVVASSNLSLALSGEETAGVVASLAVRETLPDERRPARSPDTTALIFIEPNDAFLQLIDFEPINRNRREGIVALGCVGEELYRVSRSTFVATRMPDCFH